MTKPTSGLTLVAMVCLSPALFGVAEFWAGTAARAQEPANCTSIRFAAGQSSAIVSGSVGSEEPFPCYSFAVGKGQTATLRFTRTNGNMAFSIYGVVDDRDTWSFRTEAKVYKFVVFQTLRAAPGPFALSVSVK